MLKNYTVRYMLMLVMTVAALYTLSACKGDGKSPVTVKLNPKNPVTIVVWHYYHGAQKNAFDDMVKEFNETLGYEKGIIVEAISQGGVDELAASVKAAANGKLDAGSMPNIFGAHGDTTLEILNMGMVVPIGQYLSEEELEKYEASFINEGKIGTDDLYVFPIAKSTESLMLNKTDFDAFAAGLSAAGFTETVSYDDLSTWEGIIRTAEQYYRYTDALTPDTPNDGKALFGIDGLANYVIVGSKQLGQDLISVSGEQVAVNLDDAIMTKIWDTYYEPMVRGWFTKLGRFCSDDVKTGDSLCYIGSTTSANYFPTELMLDSGEIKKIEMMVLPMPVFENGDKVAILQGAGLVVAKSSPEKEYASVLFLSWFTQAERNVTFSLGSSYLPVTRKALEENLLNTAFSAINTGDIAAQNTVMSLQVGIEQLRNYNLYVTDVFSGSTDFRYTLPQALSSAAQEDRAAYLTLLQYRVSPEQAFTQVTAGKRVKYEAWLNALSQFARN